MDCIYRRGYNAEIDLTMILEMPKFMYLVELDVSRSKISTLAWLKVHIRDSSLITNWEVTYSIPLLFFFFFQKDVKKKITIITSLSIIKILK